MVIGIMISIQITSTQIGDPPPYAYILTDKQTYYLNETVRIQVTAPENTTTNLTIQDPDSYLYITLGENLGSFTHLYNPELIGRTSPSLLTLQ